MTKKRAILIGIVIIVLSFAYTLLFGKLFPFSPVAIGFTRHELPHTVIYVQDGSKFTNYSLIDNCTINVEMFHQLKFKRKPVLYIFSSKASYFRRTTARTRFCVYPNGSMVIAPWSINEAKNGIISLEIYITHELSHVLLQQNMSYYAAYRYPPWLMEGIAVYSSHQMGTSWYPDKRTTYDLIRHNNFFPPNLYKTDREDSIPLHVENRIAFMYSEFACIVDYLITQYGEEKFYRYMKGLFHNHNHDQFFNEIYNIEFHDFLKEFIASVHT
ncbi:MAG TPA: hypothetical protein PK544_18920 [Spirochaetota bacterium]|nr:hypothetical protein [Spirochaetota bacterium]